MSKYYRTLIKTISVEINPFIIEVNTTNTGISLNNQFQFTGAVGNYTVEAYQDSLLMQTYTGLNGSQTITLPSTGIYQLHIIPSNLSPFNRIRFNNGGDKLKILKIINWGNIEWSSFERAFYGCVNLILTATDVPDLNNVTTLARMFQSATSFNTSIDNWDVSTIINMDHMFNNAISFNQDLNNWDVSNVTTMVSMFHDALNFNGNIGDWNVFNVTFMINMFTNASSFNQDISNWNISNTNMGSMFFGASSFNQNISSWDVSNVTAMNSMFRDAISFNQNLSGWCVEHIVSQPSNFDLGATNWTLSRPNWGIPC